MHKVSLHVRVRAIEGMLALVVPVELDKVQSLLDLPGRIAKGEGSGAASWEVDL